MAKLNKTLLLACSVTLFIFNSCKLTDELDLEKDLMLDMRIAAGGLTFPFGDLDKMYLDSLIDIDEDDPEAIIQKIDSTRYGIKTNGSIDKTVIDIDEISFEIASPDIDPIVTEFDDPTPDNFDIEPYDTVSTFKIDTVDIASINSSLPTISSSSTNKPVSVPGSDLSASRISVSLVVPSTDADCGFVYDSFPTDVDKIDTILFANKDGSPDEGQLMEFDVDLSSVDPLFLDPGYRIKSLVITFPDEFQLAVDDQSEFADYSSIVGKSQFKLEMSSDDSLVVALLEEHSVDPANPTIVHVSFYVKRMDIGRGSDLDGGSVMSYSGEVTYELEMEINGQPNFTGTRDLRLTMGVHEKLCLGDVSVSSKKKRIAFEQGTVRARGVVTGLDDVNRVDLINFKSPESEINIKISDMSVSPFEVLSGESKIYMQFPSEYTFGNSCSDTDGNVVGYWDPGTENRLILDAKMSMGKTIVLLLESYSMDKYKVEDGTISFNDPVAYWGDIFLSPATGLNLNDLSKLSDKSSSMEVSGYLEISDAVVETKTISSELGDSTTISLDDEIDNALILVKSVDLVNDAMLSVKLKFNGVPSTIEQLYLDSFSIEFPDFIGLEYSGDDDRISLERNILYINGDLTKSELSSTGEGFSIDGFYITGLEFDDPLHTVVINGKRRLVLNNQGIYFSGAVKVRNQNISSSELGDIVVSPEVSIGRMSVKSFIGKVYPEIDPINESVGFDLGEDMDFMQNGINSISWSDPQITLNLTSTFSVPVKMDLTLSSLEKDGTYIGQNIKPDLGYITLPACPRDSLSKTTTILIYKDERFVPQSLDTIYVRMSSLSDLMTTVPDSLRFNMITEADTSMTDEAYFHYVDITRELSIEGGYDLTIPLSFDSLYIEYNDTIDSLSSDLKDIANKLKNVNIRITAQVESTIPLGVEVSAIPLDLAGNVITSGIEVTSSRIAAGSESSPSISDLVLSVSVSDGRLSVLDAFVIKAACSASQTEGGVDLKSTGYLHIKSVVMSVLDGIDIDLTDLDK